MRLAALMQLPAIFIWTHDSIGLEEDGPTHQPVEHLASLRAIPGLDVVRPADANETAVCWRTILEHGDRPAGLVLTRQKVPVLERGVGWCRPSDGAARGGYILAEPDSGTPAVVLLLATGSEVHLALAAQRALGAQGIGARVVSLPCIEWFATEHADYRDEVLPPSVRARVSIEAGVAQGWRELVGDAGRIVSIDRFGASAAGPLLFQKFGFTVDAVTDAARASMQDAAGHVRPGGESFGGPPTSGGTADRPAG